MVAISRAVIRCVRRISAVAYVDLTVLLAGVLLLATAHGTPRAVGGIALVYFSATLFIVALFRRIGQSGHRRSAAASSKDEFGLRRPERSRSHRQGWVA